MHSLPDQTGDSVVEIAGFNEEKLLEMSNFCKISYGNNDEESGKKYFRALACDDSLSSGNEEDFAILENEKMYKTRAELTSEGYEIISFGNSFEKDAGHVFIRGKEITIVHGTRFKHGLWGLK